MAQLYDFREQWLLAGLQDCAKYFEEKGYSVPENIKVACGWPVGNRGSKRVLGQCFDPKASKGGFIEVFISPMMEDPEEVIKTVVHEMVHAVVGNQHGHGNVFRNCAVKVGLVGKMTQCVPGPALMQRIREEVLPALGAYPHASVDFNQRKKQGTRMIKLVCPVSGYTVRTTAKWIKEGKPVPPAMLAPLVRYLDPELTEGEVAKKVAYIAETFAMQADHDEGGEE